MKSCRYCVVFLCALFSIAIGTGQTWLAEDNGQYTIYYTQEYEQDVEFVRTWMDHTESLMLDKYGLRRTGFDISIYLHPAPASGAGVGLATLVCCSDGTGEIHYLTPSAPAWEELQRRGATTSLGAPFDDDYHAAVLIHEYITVGYQRISDDKSRGFRYYSAPAWFYQGLEQYDGTFHSTEANRTTGYERLLDHADRHLRDKIYCCRTLDPDIQSFGSSDVYNGGMFLMKFMADQYGREFHVDLLKSQQPTFAEALADELALRDRTVSEAFEDFQRWFEAKLEGGITATPRAAVTLLVANFSNGNSGAFNSRVYLWNPSTSAGQVTVRVFTLPLTTGIARELTGPPLDLGTLEARSALNLKLVEDILIPLGITLPYTTDGGNLTLEFTIQAADVRGAAQVFSSDFAFGTYPMQEIPSTSSGSPTVLVANFMNGNDAALNSRVYLWNPSLSAGSVTVRVFTLPLTAGVAQELTTTPLDLGTLEARSALNLKLVEDILIPLGIPTPYVGDGGNLTLEFTIQAADVRGAAQVFSSSFAFGTVPLQVIQ